MTAQLIDGNALSRQLRSEVAQRAAALKTRGVTPGLAVVLVGDNQASQVYVRNKVKACEDSGLHSVLEKYDADMTEAALLDRVEALNNDPAIHGILVQLPLPKQFDEKQTVELAAFVASLAPGPGLPESRYLQGVSHEIRSPLNAIFVSDAEGLVAASGATVLFVTHDLGVVSKVCSSLSVLYAGKVVAETTARAFFAGAPIRVVNG